MQRSFLKRISLKLCFCMCLSLCLKYDYEQYCWLLPSDLQIRIHEKHLFRERYPKHLYMCFLFKVYADWPILFTFHMKRNKKSAYAFVHQASR